MPKRSPLADKSRLAEAISRSKSQTECLRHLGLRAAGGNFAQLQAWSERHGLELPEWDRRSSIDHARNFVARPLGTILIEGSTYKNRSSLKKRLIEAELLQDQCANCGMSPEWHGKPLVLQLEHINGVHNDNRIENLCLLCPNCHSQTSSFAGRNSRKP